jgi:putative FmdB family regulatory protein
MPLYCYKCEECGYEMEYLFSIKSRKHHVYCEKCNAVAERIYKIGAAYVKHNYVGDYWEKENIEPVRDGRDLETKRRNNERIKKMREQSRINLEREKARKKQ